MVMSKLNKLDYYKKPRKNSRLDAYLCLGFVCDLPGLELWRTDDGQVRNLPLQVVAVPVT